LAAIRLSPGRQFAVRMVRDVPGATAPEVAELLDSTVARVDDCGNRPERRQRGFLRQFSDPHLAALGVLAVTAGTSVWAARRHPGRWLVVWPRVLGLVIVAGWVAEYVADAARGAWNVEYDLPLQLTDAVSAAAVLALWRPRALLVEVLYFWSLTASLQAVLTPDLGQSFPSVYYFAYFSYHVGAIVGACFLVFGCRLYPRPGAPWRVFALTLAFAAVAGAGDLITGGNYMYLRDKPAHNSLLNLMGPWPWYIVSTAALAIAMLLAVQLLANRLRRLEPVS
jgi:hypothetical integral membrane protein (TIGR02206 family)